MLAKAQHIGPATRTGVADASAISNQLHVFHRVLVRDPSLPRPFTKIRPPADTRGPVPALSRGRKGVDLAVKGLVFLNLQANFALITLAGGTFKCRGALRHVGFA